MSNPVVNLVQPGDPVAAGVVNRPIHDLHAAVRDLYTRLESRTDATGIRLSSQPVASGLSLGSPVFYNTATNQFEGALASVSTTNSHPGLRVAASANVWGVVSRLIGTRLADILVVGSQPLNIQGAVIGSVEAGTTYYLSGSQAGKLTATPGAVPIPVLQTDGRGGVLVRPHDPNILFAHTHRAYDLSVVPAGVHTDPGSGSLHTISNPNPAIVGWLPANHTSFNGKAPAGAWFGYNLAADTNLKAIWPPLPPSDACIVRDGFIVDPAEYIINADGIWWMSRGYEEVPFAPTYDTSNPPVLTPSADLAEIPHRRLTLMFVRPSSLGLSSLVTSLRSADNRIRVVCDTDTATPANVGSLALLLDLSFVSGVNDDDGALAVKQVNATTGRLDRGPVAAGIYSKTSSLVLSGGTTQVKTLEGVSRTVRSGYVGVDLNVDNNRELLVSLVRLDGVLEAYLADIPYLEFPAGQDTSFRGRIHIPSQIDLASPSLTLRFRLLGRTTGTVPNLTLGYRRIAAATLASPASLPVVDTVGTLTTTVVLSQTNRYYDVAATAFAVAPGDDVFFTLRRVAGDAYPGAVGVIRQTGRLADT
jgi:hypothetical protein